VCFSPGLAAVCSEATAISRYREQDPEGEDLFTNDAEQVKRLDSLVTVVQPEFDFGG
jgi:hypothetical protein